MYLVVCVNCGQQTMVNEPEDNCQFCGKNVSKKEVIMAEREPVPTRPKKRKQLRKYFEQHKEAIIADYNSMQLLPFYKRWGLSSNMWIKLKKDWEILGKYIVKKERVTAASSGKEPTAKEENSVARSVEAPLTEHEHYLVLLGWQQAAREFLKAGKDQR